MENNRIEKVDIEKQVESIMNRVKEKMGERIKSRKEKFKGYKCEICSDTTWVLNDGKATRCACFSKGMNEILWKNSGINKDMLKVNFTSYIPYNPQSRFAKELGIRYYREFQKIRGERKNSIAFMGQVGSGKTHLSMAIAVNLMKTKNVSVVYMPFRDTMMDIKLNMMDKDYYKRQIERFQKGGILLIDDLFKGKITDSDKNIIFEIVNHRYMNKLPIVLSSELDMKGIIRVDEAIGSRIYEMCGDFTVEIRGKENNYRMKGMGMRG